MFDLVRVRGGIGNQLFGWALCEGLRERGRRVGIDASTLGSARAFETEALFSSYKRFDLGYKAWTILSGLPGLVVHEQQATGMRLAEGARYRPRLLSGYWQAPTYFAGLEASIESQLRAWLSSSHHAPDLGSFAAVHVRRGDYVSDPSARSQLGPLEADYYKRAIAVLKDLGHDTIRLFSDDPGWADEEVAAGEAGVRVVSGRHALDDLRMMSCAAAIATANSTYSWWAAWLVARRGGTVIRPDPWYLVSDNQNPNMLPESWQRLPRLPLADNDVRDEG